MAELRSRSVRLALLIILCDLYCAAGHAADSASAEVLIEKFEFVPATVTIRKGSVIVFINKDAAEHTVAAADRSWTSKILKQGDSYTYTFDRAGDVPYICGLHPFMKGVIEVAE